MGHRSVQDLTVDHRKKGSTSVAGSGYGHEGHMGKNEKSLEHRCPNGEGAGNDGKVKSGIRELHTLRTWKRTRPATQKTPHGDEIEGDKPDKCGGEQN